jgi:hypothetical protein
LSKFQRVEKSVSPSGNVQRVVNDQALPQLHRYEKDAFV